MAIDRFPDDVPDEVKRWRNNTLLAIQGETSARVHAAWVGRQVPVLFDAVRAREGGVRAGQGAVAGGSVPVSIGGRSLEAPAPAWQAVGRTPGDLIVAVSAENEAIARAALGSIRQVQIDRAQALLLLGSEVGPLSA